MKNCINLSFLILMLYCRSYAQEVKAPKMPVNEETKLFSYSKVVEVQGMDKGSLYDRAFAWLSAYYKNPADVLREKDRDAGSMIIKARFKISNPVDKKSGVAKDAGDVQYTLKLEFKDGRFRYNLTEINWKQLSYFPAEKWLDTKNQYYSPNWNYYLKQTDDTCIKIVANLEQAITAVIKEKKDEW